jgi:hypothetical protein
MAINFPSNPTNAQEVTEGNVTYVYNATKGYWESSEVSSGGASIDVLADMTALIAATGMSNGDQAFVTGNNNLYIYSGSGWYKVATVQNDAPSAITGVSGTYELAIDGTATTITAVSTDPEGFPLTWSYSASGLGSIATISQVDNVFTITPSTTIADAGTFSLTINATDGINGAVSTTTNLTLEFIVTVTNSRYTTLLATAVDTSDNNNITDASTSNHTITVNGDAHAGTFSPYRSGGYSTYFDGAGDYLNAAGNVAFEFGTGDFSIELFFYRTASGSVDTLLQYGNASVSGYSQISWTVYISSSNYLSFEISDGTPGGAGKLSLVSSVLFPTNSWVHVSVVRDGNNFTLYQNGNSVATTTDNRSVYVSPSPLLWIARNHSAGSGDTAGFFSNVRIVKGTAVYTTNFTPPTERLTAITNTSLLTCHLPYISDGSTNNHSITVNGDVSTKPLAPYDNLEYSAADHGGSVYFDGTGDALRIADNSNIQLGTSAFTIEGWFYCNDTNPTQGIIAKRDASGEYWRWIITGGNLNFRFQSVGGGSFACNTVSVPTKTWCHFAVTRDSNNDVRQFVNGISTQNAINSTGNFDISGSSLRVGEYELNTGHFSGFVSDIKIIKNSALYTTDFTPPNAPLSSSGAELHIKGTDASIIDKSQGANIKLVGNTTGSTTQVKFADTKSIYFDGTGDEIQTPTSELFRYGTGDFTWEFWTNPSSQGTYDYIITQGSSPAGTSGLGLYLQGGVFKVYHSGAAIIIGTTSISNNTWYHVALAREGTTMRLFLDGTLEGSATNSADIQPGTSYGVVIGRWTEIGDSQYYDGYLQDLRVTKGLARYTANFTPPTASLEG